MLPSEPVAIPGASSRSTTPVPALNFDFLDSDEEPLSPVEDSTNSEEFAATLQSNFVAGVQDGIVSTRFTRPVTFSEPTLSAKAYNFLDSFFSTLYGSPAFLNQLSTMIQQKSALSDALRDPPLVEAESFFTSLKVSVKVNLVGIGSVDACVAYVEQNIVRLQSDNLASLRDFIIALFDCILKENNPEDYQKMFHFKAASRLITKRLFTLFLDSKLAPFAKKPASFFAPFAALTQELQARL